MPGATSDLMDRIYLGDVKAPAQVPHPDNDRPEFIERIAMTIERIMSETSRPDVDEGRAMAERLGAKRPDFATMTDRELLSRQRKAIRQYCADRTQGDLRMVYEGSVVAGALDQARSRPVIRTWR